MSHTDATRKRLEFLRGGAVGKGFTGGKGAAEAHTRMVQEEARRAAAARAGVDHVKAHPEELPALRAASTAASEKAWRASAHADATKDKGDQRAAGEAHRAAEAAAYASGSRRANQADAHAKVADVHEAAARSRRDNSSNGIAVGLHEIKWTKARAEQEGNAPIAAACDRHAALIERIRDEHGRFSGGG